MSSEVYNEDVKIPNNLVGLVIGRGGDTIKKLQAESQCKIKIASDPDGSPQRSCTLTGSQDQIDLAKQLLEEIVQRGQNREQGGGNYQRRDNGNRGGYQGGYRGQQQGGYQGGYQGGHQGGFGGQQGGFGGQQGGYGGQQQGGYQGGNRY